jgi:AcrR family transcriptional regulator
LRTVREVAGDERRAAIVAAALEVFAERGYKAASLARIADRVGITHQAVLYHFLTKQQLLVAALEERDREDRIWWAAQASESGQGFLELCQRLVEHNMQRPAYVRMFTVLAGDSVTEEHPAHGFFQARYERLRQQLGPQLDAAYRRAGRRGPSIAVVLAILDGLQLQWLLEPDGFDMAQEFGSFLAVILGPGADGVPGEQPER